MSAMPRSVTFPQREWFVCWALSVTRRWYKREAAAEGAEWTGARTLRFR